jgi:hypothetical protein
MTAEVLFTVHGSYRRWTGGYDGVDDATLRRLLVESNFASRSIEFELFAREVEQCPGSSPANTPAKPPFESRKAKERTRRRTYELRGLYESLQNTADTVKKMGCLTLPSTMTFKKGSCSSPLSAI